MTLDILFLRHPLRILPHPYQAMPIVPLPPPLSSYFLLTQVNEIHSSPFSRTQLQQHPQNPGTFANLPLELHSPRFQRIFSWIVLANLLVVIFPTGDAEGPQQITVKAKIASSTY